MSFVYRVLSENIEQFEGKELGTQISMRKLLMSTKVQQGRFLPAQIKLGLARSLKQERILPQRQIKEKRLGHRL